MSRAALLCLTGRCLLKGDDLFSMRIIFSIFIASVVASKAFNQPLQLNLRSAMSVNVSCGYFSYPYWI
jgi:hypothetical protein